MLVVSFSRAKKKNITIECFHYWNTKIGVHKPWKIWLIVEPNWIASHVSFSHWMTSEPFLTTSNQNRLLVEVRFLYSFSLLFSFIRSMLTYVDLWPLKHYPTFKNKLINSKHSKCGTDSIVVLKLPTGALFQLLVE